MARYFELECGECGMLRNAEALDVSDFVDGEGWLLEEVSRGEQYQCPVCHAARARIVREVDSVGNSMTKTEPAILPPELPSETLRTLALKVTFREKDLEVVQRTIEDALFKLEMETIPVSVGEKSVRLPFPEEAKDMLVQHLQRLRG